jgi:hypothetical protein
MYLYGSQEGADYADGNNFTAASTVYVGNNYASSGDYKGYIDELLMYNIALDAGTFPPTEQIETAHTTIANISGVKLQTEIVIPDTKVAGIVLQVEVDVPTYAGPEGHTVKIEVFELEPTIHILEAGSNQGAIVFTGHGLVADDMILNTNRIGYDTGGGTYVNGYGAAEPGCRRISQILLGDPYVLPDLIGQAPDDPVYFYKWKRLFLFDLFFHSWIQKLNLLSKNQSPPRIPL